MHQESGIGTDEAHHYVENLHALILQVNADDFKSRKTIVSKNVSNEVINRTI